MLQIRYVTFYLFLVILKFCSQASRCTKYKIRQGRQLNSWDNDLDLSEGFKESPWGSARTGPISRKPTHDMFSWMASPFREEPPPFSGQDGESSISRYFSSFSYFKVSVTEMAIIESL